MTTPLDRLGVLLSNILQRVSDEKLKGTAQALIPAMPKVVESLTGIISDPETSQSAKLQANGILYSLWARCTRLDDKAGERKEAVAKAGARKETAKARAARAKVEEKELTLKERRHQERKAKKRAKALAAAGELGIGEISNG